jgi:hypothetical protein
MIVDIWLVILGMGGWAESFKCRIKIAEKLISNID